MHQIIAIESAKIGENSVQTVNARDVYDFLDVGKDFSTWVKVQITRCRLAEGRDYTCSPSRGSEGRGGQNRIDYHLTLDAGKQISMMSETDKGFEVRDYFIECERVAQAAPLDAPTHSAIGLAEQSLQVFTRNMRQLVEAGMSHDEACIMCANAGSIDTGVWLPSAFLISESTAKQVKENAIDASPATTQRHDTRYAIPRKPHKKPRNILKSTHYSQKDLAYLLVMSNQDVRARLERRGYVTWDSESDRYIPTKEGEKILKRSADGTILWRKDMLDPIRKQ